MPLYRVLAEQSIIFEQFVHADSEEEAESIAKSEGAWHGWDTRGHEDQMTVIDVSIEEDDDEF